MVVTNDSTNEKHNFYNSTVQAISRGGGYHATSFVALCAHFVDMGSAVKTQVENGLSKIFGLRGHTIDTPDQAVFNSNYSSFHDEERKKINTSNPLTAA